MARTTKKAKPIFAMNLIARRKAMGLSAEKFAEKAGLSYPTIRDIEAGINSGREDTKRQIAAALDCNLADLYFDPQDSNRVRPSKQSLIDLIDHPKTYPFASMANVIDELSSVAPAIRATILAILYDDQTIAEPYLSKNGIRAKTLKAR